LLGIFIHTVGFYTSGENEKIELMVFDFDGTLVYSGDDLANSVNHTLKKLGIPVLDKRLS